MYQVFNMGHRLEVFTNAAAAEKMIRAAEVFNIEAKIIGRVEPATTSGLILKGAFGELKYEY